MDWTTRSFVLPGLLPHELCLSFSLGPSCPADQRQRIEAVVRHYLVSMPRLIKQDGDGDVGVFRLNWCIVVSFRHPCPATGNTCLVNERKWHEADHWPLRQKARL